MIRCVINVKNRTVRVLVFVQQYQKVLVLLLQSFFEIGIGNGNTFCRVYWYWYCYCQIIKKILLKLVIRKGMYYACLQQVCDAFWFLVVKSVCVYTQSHTHSVESVFVKCICDRVL